MASVPPVTARSVETRLSTAAQATVPTEPVATATVRMVHVRTVCVPADNARHVQTDNVQDVPTAAVAAARVQEETARMASADSIRIRMLVTIPAGITEFRETGRLARRGRILPIRFVSRNTRMKMTTGRSVPPCEIL